MNKTQKTLLIIIVLLIVIPVSLFTFDSKFRRTIFYYIFVTHDYYQLKSLSKNVQFREFLEASIKLERYINISKKISNDSTYMTNGIYEAVEFVADRAVLQDDYNHLEKTFIELHKMQPKSYKTKVWLARSLSDNNLEKSLKLLDSAIESSPSREEAYREILRISMITNNSKLAKKYCDLYKKSQLGGDESLYYQSFFGSNNLRNFAINFNSIINRSSKEGNFFYVNDGIILNEFTNYEFILKKNDIKSSINFYFSLLSGTNVQIKEIKIFSENNQLIIPLSKMNVYSKNGYFIEDKKSISVIFSDRFDEFLKITFDKKFYLENKNTFDNAEKIKILMNFVKLDLTNETFCKRY